MRAWKIFRDRENTGLHRVINHHGDQVATIFNRAGGFVVEFPATPNLNYRDHSFDHVTGYVRGLERAVQVYAEETKR